MTTIEETTTRGLRVTARQIALILIAIGLMISGYLSYVKLVDAPIICTESAIISCDVVQNSRWAELAGIPVAYLGFGMYVLLGAIVVLENRIAFLEANGRLILFALGLFGWLFAMWLVYLQVAVIQALCPWCLAFEIDLTLLFGTFIYMLWKDLQS